MQIDIDTLNPVQRMELADALYDSAMQQIEAVEPLLTTLQRQELDRRMDRSNADEPTLLPWDEKYSRSTLETFRSRF